MPPAWKIMEPQQIETKTTHWSRPRPHSPLYICRCYHVGDLRRNQDVDGILATNLSITLLFVSHRTGTMSGSLVDVGRDRRSIPCTPADPREFSTLATELRGCKPSLLRCCVIICPVFTCQSLGYIRSRSPYFVSLRVCSEPQQMISLAERKLSIQAAATPQLPPTAAPRGVVKMIVDTET